MAFSVFTASISRSSSVGVGTPAALLFAAVPVLGSAIATALFVAAVGDCPAADAVTNATDVNASATEALKEGRSIDTLDLSRRYRETIAVWDCDTHQATEGSRDLMSHCR